MMKRYNILGEPIFDLVESKDGNLILFEEFENFILARIKELEIRLINTNPKRKETVLRRQEVIDELKNLIK